MKSETASDGSTDEGKYVTGKNGVTVKVTWANLHASAYALEMDHSDLAELIGCEDSDGYQIACRLFTDRQRVYSRAALGESFGRRYDSEEEAQAEADRLQAAADRSDNGLIFMVI